MVKTGASKSLYPPVSEGSMYLHPPTFEKQLVISFRKVSGRFGDFSLHVFENIKSRNGDLDCSDHTGGLNTRSLQNSEYQHGFTDGWIHDLPRRTSEFWLNRTWVQEVSLDLRFRTDSVG